MPFVKVLHGIYNQLVKITEQGEGADSLFRLWNIISLCKLLAEAVFFDNKHLIEVISICKHSLESCYSKCGASSRGSYVTWEFIGHAVPDPLNYIPHF